MSQCDPEVLLSVVQLCVRLFLMTFVSIGAILCINWGWRLYRDCVVSRTSGELQSQNMKLKFTAAGPGVLLVAFGAWLLSLVATHQFSVETSTPTKPTAYIESFPKAQNSQTADYRFWKTNEVANPTVSVPPPQDLAKSERCAVRRFASRNMDGNAWEPTSQEIQSAIETSMAAVRASTAVQPTSSPHSARVLRTLSYLREMTALEVRQDPTGTSK